MRKFYQRTIGSLQTKRLQCGRIYKDAEIWSVAAYNAGGTNLLQCGRIYKDAEIAPLLRAGAESKARFNVAASIKMRKFSARIHVRT